MNTKLSELYVYSQWISIHVCVPFVYASVSQPPDRGPVPGHDINYTGPQEVNILYWKYSEENNIREYVEKLRPRTSK
jgi:hypothetical protein